MSDFVWGEVIQRFAYDFDGQIMEVVKYHPRKREGCTVTQEIDKTKIEYHVDALHEAFHTLEAALIAWIARKNVGLNQYSLVAGICKVLNIKES